MDDPDRRGAETPALVHAAGQATWVAGLTLALSSFMGWYSGTSTEGPTVSVLGWNTGTLGKFVFVLGVAIVLLAVRRGAGIELPRSLPESLIVVVLGTTATILLLIRIVSIPDEFAGTADRAIGLWVGLASAVVAIVAGLVRAGEEL
ncbi:MAG TPA: hypothetical protein VFR32_05245 [Gaiellaceae bacterium]|nr:hypothetical protein [Gaiellaceae bacterium]